MLMGMGAIVGDSIASTHLEIGGRIFVVISAVKEWETLDFDIQDTYSA
jgi:hypothetical protein